MNKRELIDKINQAIFLEREGSLDKSIYIYESISEHLGRPLWLSARLDRIKTNKSSLGYYCSIKDNNLSYFVDVNTYKSSQSSDNHRIECDLNIDSRLSEFKTNDYSQIEYKKNSVIIGDIRKISVVLTTYNRYILLSKTLASLVRQSIGRDNYEVIIVDDGSQDDYLPLLIKYEKHINIRYARQPDKGYRVGEARNLGAKIAAHQILFFLDSDILLPDNFLEEVSRWHETGFSKIITLGTRKFINSEELDEGSILSKGVNDICVKETISENQLFKAMIRNGVTYDWRLDIYEASRNLKDHIFPFVCLGGGHFSIEREFFLECGCFDKNYSAWGGEDIDFGYRAYINGAYFIPITNVFDYHQEPDYGINQTDRVAGHRVTIDILLDKCPAPIVRPSSSEARNEYRIPKVSIYIPAYNSERTIERAINSVLNQSFYDLEICVCDDGSTDNTLSILERLAAGDKRIKVTSVAKNKGISHASNLALRMCNGLYIGQLDADDELLPGAISACVSHLDSHAVGLVYTDYLVRIESTEEEYPGYSDDSFSFYWQITGNMICHFRFFRRRNLSLMEEWFDESLANGVDFDFYTRMAEVTLVEKLRVNCYRYNIHNSNTSIINIATQRENHLKVVSKTIRRLSLSDRHYATIPNPLLPRNIHIRDTEREYSDKINWIPIDPDFPLPEITGCANDYRAIEELKNSYINSGKQFHKRCSVIIPVFNRFERLSKTLAGICNQTYPRDLIEIVVCDDGSTDRVRDVILKYESVLNIKYLRQQDMGFRVSHARNMGAAAASNECIINLDCDLIPCPEFVSEFMAYLHVAENVLCLGHYKFIDAASISDEEILANPDILSQLDEISSENKAVRGASNLEGPTKDWRLSIYNETNYLIEDPYPYRACSGGQTAFTKSMYIKSGGYDEDYTDWGCEDNDFGFRMYETGVYIIPVLSAIDYHQEPPEGENETNREDGWLTTRRLLQSKCPPFRSWFGYDWEISENDTPKVSIYIPTLNGARYISEAIDSCLNQTFKDFEVCVLDSGSTDNTLEILKNRYRYNRRVRWSYKKCRNVTEARHEALKLCRGIYIGQLDCDDRLKPNAIHELASFLDINHDYGLVYSRYETIDENGLVTGEGWNSGDFDRLRLMTVMCAHHFRMFRKRAWILTGGFSDYEIENLTYAEDFSMALKLSRVSRIGSINSILYQYRIHDSNITNNNDNRRKGELTRTAAQLNLLELGLSSAFTCITPYPDMPGLVGYLKNDLDT